MAVHQRVSCEMMLASGCNLSCTYCLAKELRPDKMTKSTASKAIELFIDLAQGAADLEVIFTGGEPLLARQVLIFLLSRVSKLAKASGMKPHFVLKTNGTLLTDELIVHLKDFSVRTVVSLDGRPDCHDACRVSRTGKTTQSLVMQNLRRLARTGIECVASMTVVPRLSSRIFDNVRYLIDCGIRNIDVGPAYGTVHWPARHIRRLADSLLQIAEVIRTSREKGIMLEIGPLHKESDHRDEVLADIWGCHAGSTNLAFLPDGRVAGCSSLAMLTPSHPDLVVGDAEHGIDQASLDALLSLTQASGQDRPACSKCAGAVNCAGGCLAINLSEQRQPHSPPAFYCSCIKTLPKALGIAWN